MNSLRTIEKCVSCLLNQDYAGDYEIIVVDGGSKDGSIEVLEKLQRANKRLQQIVAKGCSEGEGYIIGIKAAKGERLMVTNADTYVQRDWITRHMRRLDEGYGLVGGIVISQSDDYADVWNNVPEARPWSKQRYGAGFSLGNCSMPKTFFTEHKIPWVNRHPDVVWGLAAHQYGIKMIIDPNIKVIHDHPLGNYTTSFKKSVRYSKAHIAIVRRIYGHQVAGGGSGVELKMGLLIQDVLGIIGVRTWRYNRPNIGLLRYLYLRSAYRFGFFTGVIIGLLFGQ